MQQMTFQFGSEMAYNCSDFICMPSNQLAYHAVVEHDGWEDGLILIGSEQTGKTHLAHLAQEKYAGQFLSSADLDLVALQDILSPNKLVILDWPTFCYARHQEKLFHFLNMAKEKKSWTLITATCGVKHWGLTLADTISRLLKFPVVEIKKPEEALLEVIITKHLSENGVRIDPSLIQSVLQRADRSPAAIVQLLQRCSQQALAEKTPLTLSFLKKFL